MIVGPWILVSVLKQCPLLESNVMAKASMNHGLLYWIVTVWSRSFPLSAEITNSLHELVRQSEGPVSAVSSSSRLYDERLLSGSSRLEFEVSRAGIVKRGVY